MIQLGNAVNHGLPYGFFAGGSFYSTNAPTTVLCVAKNSPIRSAKDLEGQAIAVVALTSISSLSVQEWLRQNGADLTKIKLFETPFSTMAPALERGTVAAAFIAEPFLSGAKTEIRWLAKTYDAIAKQFYIQAWFTSRDFLAKDPETGRRLLRAVYESARWSNAHHDASAAILSKYSKLPVERIESMTRAVFATSLDPRMMQPVLDVAARYKLIEKPLSARDLVLNAG
jgi:NitT/TauT family transport system substrate-binding protein